MVTGGVDVSAAAARAVALLGPPAMQADWADGLLVGRGLGTAGREARGSAIAALLHAAALSLQG